MDPILKTLTETMTVEAIAIIKAKRLAMKQSVDKNAMQMRAQEREKGRNLDNMQKELGRRAMKRERPCRVFEEQLLGEKEMTTAQEYLKLAHHSMMRSLDSTVPELSQLEMPPPPEIMTEPPWPKTKYNRYGQEKFLKAQQEFGINPQGSNLENCATFHESQKDKRNRSVSRESIERSRSNSKDRRSSKLYARMPIIVVPDAMTSMISLNNIKTLLEELHYEPERNGRQFNPPECRPREVIVEHRFQVG